MLKHWILKLSAVFVFLCFSSLSGLALAESLVPLSSELIRAQTMNLENLFDADHDAGRNDFEYLPINHPEKVAGCQATAGASYLSQCLNTDWNEAKVERKISQLQRAVRSFGTLPDLLGVTEVENLSVLQRFGQAIGLTGALLEEGGDLRGIDVGLLWNDTRLEKVSHRRVAITAEEATDRDSRDILAVYLRVRSLGDSSPILAIYVNHWPAQGNPARLRTQAALKLINMIDEDRARFAGKEFLPLALGDFNTVDADDPHPFRQYLLNGSFANRLYDARERMRVKFPRLERELPLGSYFFVRGMVWNELDRIFLDSAWLDGQGSEARLESFHIHRNELVSRDFTYNSGPHAGTLIKQIPFRSNPNAQSPDEAGYSDHFSISIDLEIQKSNPMPR